VPSLFLFLPTPRFQALVNRSGDRRGDRLRLFLWLEGEPVNQEVPVVGI